MGELGLNTELDSEETISDFSIQDGEVIKRRCNQKALKKKLSYSHGTPKCFQFVKATREGKGTSNRKGRAQGGGSKHNGGEEVDSRAHSGDGNYNVLHMPCDQPLIPSGQPSPNSGLRILMEESWTWVPDSPSNSGEVSRRKDLDPHGFLVCKKRMVSRLKLWTKIRFPIWSLLKI